MAPLVVVAATAFGACNGCSATTAPDIAEQLSGPSELEQGRPDHYRLVVTNIGSLAAATVTARMTFSASVTLDTRLNTATGRRDLKSPKNCTCVAAPVKSLTCLANNVLSGQTRTFLSDLRAPSSGSAQGAFTWTAAVPGDLNTANNTATPVMQFGTFTPNANQAFPTAMALWVAMGKKSVLENPMTGNPGILAFDAYGEGAGSMDAPVTWHATVVGPGLNIKINSAMYQAAVDMNLTPFSSRCFQGMGCWTGLQDWYEVRVCF